MKTKTIIIFEKRRRTTIRLRRRNRTALCELCAAETEMLSMLEAAVASDTTQLAIFRRLENGELHFLETDSGVLLICRNSLTTRNYKTKGA